MEGRPRTVEEVAERQRTLREEFRRLQHALESKFGEAITKRQILDAAQACEVLRQLARGLKVLSDDRMREPEAWQKALEGLVSGRMDDKVGAIQSEEIGKLKDDLNAIQAELANLREQLETGVNHALQKIADAQGKVDVTDGLLKEAIRQRDDLSQKIERLEEIARELDACEANGASARAKPAGGLMEGRGKPRRRGRAVCHPGTRGERRRARR